MGDGDCKDDAQHEARKRRLIEQFFNEAHVSMWACDRDFRVVLWNRGAEEIYGYTAEEILGQVYHERFIDDAEVDASIEDCAKIIDRGRRYRNLLAYDQTEDGEARYMLTNCFRISDPVTGDRYQAEIGIDIGDLELRKNEHRALRELGIERRTALRLAAQQGRDALLYRISRLQQEIGYVQRDIARELEVFQSGASSRHSAQAEQLATQAKRQLRSEVGVIQSELESMRRAAQEAKSLDDVRALDERLGADPTVWTDRLRAARLQ